ncbi:DUF637 domain-containing protein [Stutzerimonas stutzeri]
MDVRSPFFQNVATILVGVMFLNPIVSAAADLTVAAGSGATIGQAGNGVPIVNIAAPNGNGLSHNKFKDYNVGQQGLILNNATERTQSTQLGGIILGNSNLNGKAAGLILNEVTGANASRLQGYTEVAGKSAHVVVANPHGITCDGCGFINTPRVTLSTGTPVIEGGRLDRFDVNGGSIAIEGQGLNASNVDQFDLITRSAKINAELHANKLNIIAGRNEVDASTLAATAKAPDDSNKPLLAIDSSALGGMYAGAIRLVGTEAGVGVKLAGDMAASAGDIRIDANGQLSVAQATASRDLIVRGVDVELEGQAYAGRSADLNASSQLINHQLLAGADGIKIVTARLVNQGDIEAGLHPDNSRNPEADLVIHSGSMRNSGNAVANRTLDIKLASKLDNSGGGLSGSVTTIESADVDNTQNGLITARDSLHLNAGTLDNRGGVLNAQRAIVGQVDVLTNRGGEITSQEAISLSGGVLDNSKGGRIISTGELTVATTKSNNSEGGLISGWQGISLTGQSLNNSHAGTLSSKNGNITVKLSQGLDNRREGAVVSKEAQSLTAAWLDNREGGIISGQSSVNLKLGELDNGGVITASDDLTLAVSGLRNVGGALTAGTSLGLNGDSLSNVGGQISSQGSLSLVLSLLLDNSSGVVSAKGPLVLRGDNIRNRSGQAVGEGLLQLFARQLENTDGGVIAGDALVYANIADKLDNSYGGLLFSRNGAVEIEAGEFVNRSGSVQAANTVDLAVSTTLDNRGGRIVSETATVSLQADELNNAGQGILGSVSSWVALTLGKLLDNRNGTIQAKSGLTVRATDPQGQIFNQGGYLSTSDGETKVTTGSLFNQGGELYGASLLSVTARHVDNQGSTSVQGGRMTAELIDFSLAGSLNNAYGLIEAQRAFELDIGSLSNGKGQLRALGPSGTSSLRSSGLIDNRAGNIEVANTDFVLTAATYSNTDGTLSHLGQGVFGLSSNLIMNAGGALFTNGDVSLSADSWAHSGSLQARSMVLDIGTFTQAASSQLIAKDGLVLTGTNWTNDGVIASDGTVSLALGAGTYRGDGTLSSNGRLALSAGSVTLSSATAGITGGDSSEVNATGTLWNRGRLVSVGDFTLRAAVLNNNGTLGAADSLTLYTPMLSNDNGLIFSGADTALRVGTFVNSYANVYSMGTLDITGNDSGGWATRIDNLSGSLESAGNMRLLSRQLNNSKDDFTTERQITDGNVNVYWNDYCDGKGCELYFHAVERFEDVIKSDSPTAYITSGGNLSFKGTSFNNLYSTVSAAGDITIDSASFANIGAGGGEQRNVSSGFYTRDRGLYSDFIAAKDRFNASVAQRGKMTLDDIVQAGSGNSQLTIDEIIRVGGAGGFYNTSKSVVETAGSASAPAIVQAGGNVTINATQELRNDVVRSHAQGTGLIGDRDTGVSNGSFVQRVAITSQLPPDLSQKQIDPVALPGFSLPTGVNGLFRLSSEGAADTVIDGQGLQHIVNRSANAHRYLVETNPALTNLKQFMSSDYLLGNLGYNTDQTQKRLGDGLYEQRLVRDAIVARTGQRYLAGLHSDEAMYRYLMDNALASKEALNLSLGVSLTAEQVAALTHDIVWMEEQQILGERVLVPVVYLAQAKGRLAGNGALIQGRDLNLISGGDLSNRGTLRAGQNLNARAATVINAGLMEANERLQLMAIDSLQNASGGVLKGRDVSLTALTGDVINERTVTTTFASGGNDRIRNDIVNNAARIEAGGNLAIVAGRDIQNIGSVMQAGGDASLNAGRDVVIDRQEEIDTYEYRRKRESGYENSVTQYGSSVTVGGDLDVAAGRDVAVIASEVKVGDNITIDAAENLIVASAADEYHQYSYRKQGKTKTTRQNDNVSQVSSLIQAGGEVLLAAGDDIGLIASRVEAGNDAYLYAGRDLSLLAAEDSDYSLYDMKKKGSFGAKKTQRDEVTTVRNIGSSITTGGDLILVSEGDQLYQKARLESGNDLILDSGGSITFEAVKDLDQESHEKSSNSWAWTSAKGKGSTDETLYQSQLIAKGDLVIQAVDGLRIDVKEVNQQSVSQTIDAMVKADPEVAWLKEMEQRGDVDWRQVKEIHDSFKYSHSGLGAGAQLILAIAMAVIMGPAGLGLTGAQGAVAASVATTATNSAISNKGNLSAVFKDVTSKDAIKGYVVSGVTAGVGAKMGYSPTDLGLDWKSVGQVAAKTAVDAGVKTAVYGGSLKSNLAEAAIGNAVIVAGAIGADAIGGLELKSGSLEKIVLHAALGGLLAEASGGDFRTGALAAGASEALVGLLAEKLLPQGVDRTSPEYQQGMHNLVAASQIIGVLAAGLTGGDVQAAAAVAANATANNYLRHQDVEAMVNALEGCGLRGDCQQIRDDFRKISDANRARLAQCEQNGNCEAIKAEIAEGKAALDKLQGYALAVAEADFNTRQWQDGNSVQTILNGQANRSAESAAERSQRQEAEKLVEVAKDPEGLKQLTEMRAQAAYRADLEQKLLADAEVQRLAQQSAADLAADLDQLMPGWRTHREQSLDFVDGVKQGGVLLADVVSPDAWDLLGPSAKAAKLAGIFAGVGKVSGKVSADLVESAAKLNNLLAGKTPSSAELAPFTKAAERQLAEEIKLANQTLAKKPVAAGGGPKGIVNATSHKADDIRFSQNTVTFNKTDKDGGAFTYSDLVKSMKSDGWKGDPVDVVRMPDGKLTSIDNTRIAAAREAGIDVKATVRGFDDLLSASEIKRFTIPKKGFVPKTWGEAITGRINKQTGGFSKENTYGASQPPRITGRE